MQKYIIITPTYNDWKSLDRLITRIGKIKKKVPGIFEIIIINDHSNIKKRLKKKYINIKSIKIINLKKNLGSQKAIYIGLQYMKKKKIKSIITVMDSDGEDDPNKIPDLLKLAKKNKDFMIIANRSRRTENPLLKFLNLLRLFLTFIITGKYLNFGNYSSFHSNCLKKILKNSNLGLAYSAGITKNFNKFIKFPIDKKERLYGNSKVSFTFLLSHSINIITVFKNEVFFRSLVIGFVAFYFFNYGFFVISILIMLLINIIISLNKYSYNTKNFDLSNISNIDSL